MDWPRDPIAAVTHPDPYPFYAELVAHRPLYRDETLSLWVASSAAAVTAVLASDLCRVRPPAEPVPRALLGSPAGELFGHFIRMNDGPGHCPFRGALATVLDALDPASVAEPGRRWARALVGGVPGVNNPADFAFRLSGMVLGSLLGVPEQDLERTVLWNRGFVAAATPGASPAVLAEGKEAAGHLLALFRSLLASPSAGLLTTLAAAARQVGRGDDTVIAANGIGLLFQAYDATAGLIGNTLIALAADGDLRERAVDPGLLSQVVQETLRFDPPVQNTRRFVARDGIVAGEAMKEGDAILVVLAAADRDPAANPDPDRFDPFRTDRRIFTFGAGGHACPGERLAATIAQAGVEALLHAGLDPERFAAGRLYKPAGNVRVPFREIGADR
ncbi:MAG TPA: cytochrome P450 [Thermoanaerobaculia bacterium]|nr:cytochrome P450 [Thermoanaerobaculia bacterium]